MLPLREIPKDIQFRRYDQDGCEFAFPDGAKFAHFDPSPDGTRTVRMIWEGTGGRSVRIEFEYPIQAASARLAAEEFSQRKKLGLQLPTDPLAHYNLTPQPLMPKRQDAWRLRWGWRDPAYPPMVNDITFIELPAGLYKISYWAEPREYDEDGWVLDAMLQTFRTAESSS